MADTLTVEVGATAVVPLAFESSFGVAAGPVPVSVAAEAGTIATAAVGADGLSVEVAGVSPGSTQVTVTVGDVTDHMHVDVTLPVAKVARLVPAAVTFRRTGA